LIAILALSGAVSDSAYAAHRKHHHGKYSEYKPDKNAKYFGGKHISPKKQKLPKHTYGSH